LDIVRRDGQILSESDDLVQEIQTRISGRDGTEIQNTEQAPPQPETHGEHGGIGGQRQKTRAQGQALLLAMYVR